MVETRLAPPLGQSALAKATTPQGNPLDQSAQFREELRAGKVEKEGGVIITLDYTVEDGFLVIRVPMNRQLDDVRTKKIIDKDTGKVTKSVTLVCSLRPAVGADNCMYLQDGKNLLAMPLKPLNINIGLDHKKLEIIETEQEPA